MRHSKSKPNEPIEALFESFLRYMKEERGLDIEDIARLVDEKDITVPITVFALDISPSEALCKYLKENRGLSFRKIGVFLNRDERSAWTSYQRAQKKHPEPFPSMDDALAIPVSIFTQRDLSILEHVVSFALTRTGMSIPALSRLLCKHPSALHTVAKRAAKKQSFTNEGGNIVMGVRDGRI